MAADINIKEVQNIDPVTIADIQKIAPLTIADIQHAAPVAVHLKELNQIAPLFVESLRVDHVRHIDPLRIDRLDITQFPSLNLSLSQMPSLDIEVRRVPPVAIALQQQLDLNSLYTMTARVLGFPLMRMELTGTTTMTPRDCARREQSRSHERSFPDVAAAGNPAIPSRKIETCTRAVTRCAPPQHPQPHPPQRPLHAGAPRFSYSLESSAPPPSGGSVSMGS
ncbi:MAG TPA: hypothetical protein VMU01_03240 [Rhizomicrobium sp.]|nr:hypothetical protein [Rhizomicrobium sp.]